MEKMYLNCKTRVSLDGTIGYKKTKKILLHPLNRANTALTVGWTDEGSSDELGEGCPSPKPTPPPGIYGDYVCDIPTKTWVFFPAT